MGPENSSDHKTPLLNEQNWINLIYKVCFHLSVVIILTRISNSYTIFQKTYRFVARNSERNANPWPQHWHSNSESWNLTPRSRVCLKKLTVAELVKKFHACYGTGWFITKFTRALLWARWIQFTFPHSLSSIIILTIPHVRLSLLSGLFPSGVSTDSLYAFLFCFIRAVCLVHLILLDLIIPIIFCVECK
jgi:hypothetical protein